MFFKNLNRKINIWPVINSTIIITFSFAIAGGIVYYAKISEFKSQVRRQQEIEATSLRLIIQKYIVTMKNDVSIFSEIPLVKNYITNPKDYRYELYHSIKRVGEEKRDYDQFRIINLHGHEIFRVNYPNQKGTLVPAKQLQDKSKRYYYQEATVLNKGQVVVSNYDYNIERGKVERPIKPTLRITTPIYINNQKSAYLTINFNSANLANEIKIFKKLTEFDIYIVNNQKQFLCYKSCISKKLEDVYENPDKHKPLLDKIFTANSFFNISNSYFYKIKIPLNTIYSNGRFIYLVIELPASKYLAHKGKASQKIIFYTLLLYFITLIVVYILLFLSSLINKGAIQLRKASKLLELSAEGIVITDENGIIEYVNPTFEKMFRCGSADALGLKISKFKSNYHDKSFYNAMWKRLNNTGKWEGDIVDMLPDQTKQVKHLRIERIADNKAKEVMFIGIYSDITKIKKSNNTVKRLIALDYLTGLPNKQTVLKRINEKIEESSKENKNFSIISISIYNLKEINDIYGFDIGDKVILLFIERVKSKIENGDILGRIGDNHFLLISNEHSFEDLNEYVSYIFRDCTAKPFTLGEWEIYLSVNVGISTYPDNGVTGEELVKASSLAIDDSSTEDKLSINYYSETLSLEAKEKVEMMSLLEKAIQKNEFQLKFQPKVDSRDNSIVGAEALIRWHNSKLGNVPPSIFIPLAEENGMINRISSWVVHRLCAHIKEWKKKGIPIKPVSFNLSPYDFARKDFPACLFECMEECGVDSKKVEVEITEGALVKNPEDVIKKISELKSKGFKILIDDFGTGYSSLEYLKNFDIDILKIDRSFIKHYPENNDGKIAKTICALAHSLNMGVICEGVKTQEQLDYMSSLGCYVIQGFYFSTAVTSEVFEELLINGKVSPKKNETEKEELIYFI